MTLMSVLFSDCEEIDLPKNPYLHRLMELARQRGATHVECVRPRELVIEDGLAAYCNTPGCPNYGLGAGCPPHVEGPDRLRQWRDEAEYVLVLRIDVPAAVFHSEERDEVMRLLHEIVAEVELAALAGRYVRSRGFAGGSCKHLFCRGHGGCLRLEGGLCRNPLVARPSMSGFGVNVALLMQAAGWNDKQLLSQDGIADSSCWFAGMVLLGR
jgi:predicted metal-binding protein